MVLDTAHNAGFACFPKLLPELRTQIWLLAATEPRLIRIRAQKPERGTDWLSSSPAPALMHVCREARVLVPHTKAFFSSSQSRYVWVDFDVDMIVLDNLGKPGPNADPLHWLACDSPEAMLIQRFRCAAGFSSEDVGYNGIMSFSQLLEKLACLRELQLTIKAQHMEYFVTQEMYCREFTAGYLECCDQDSIRLIDTQTGLFMTIGQARLLVHWEWYNGGLVKEEEREEDEYCEAYVGESWLEQVDNVENHGIIY